MMLMSMVHVLFISIGFLLFRRWRDGLNELEGLKVTGKMAAPEHDQPLSVSIIIPARNEEQNLKQLLPLLMQQQLPAYEIIVVDDNSTDGTSLIAQQHGAKVVHPGALPRGWLGKSWACWNGAQAANGELFVFLDADTIPAPNFVGWVAHHWKQHRGFLTIQPYHMASTMIEQLSAFFNVIVLAGSGQFTGNRAWGRSFGPCAACSRVDYQSMGGHEAIKSAVLEHLQMGNHYRQSGHANVAYAGKGVLQFRMYPDGLAELTRGWTKSIALGAGSTAIVPLIGVSLWMVGLFGAAIGLTEWLLGSGAWWSLLVYAFAVIQLRWILRNTGTFRFLTALLYPITLSFFTFIFAWASIRSFIVRKVTWKGRDIHVD
jgi:4,4'-diaponeurosporenoate glycosyltransferase